MNHERGAEVHNVLQFIEDNLENELNLDIIARHAAASKYHFHRRFHAYTGTTLASYIRKRRLSSAASKLLTTDQRILEIALDYQFESQEAFTRAFKKMFQMPPNRYRTFMKKLIQKRECRPMTNNVNKEPKGWFLSGSHPSDYEMGIDLTTSHHGKASGYLHSKRDSAGGFATMMQMFKAQDYRGQRLQLSGFLKTQEVEEWCGLWMRIDGKDAEILEFDNMGNRPISGTTNWTRYTIVLDVPRESEAISFGILLCGKGRVWADSLQFEVVGDDVPTTGAKEEEMLPDNPVNLNFEDLQEL